MSDRTSAPEIDEARTAVIDRNLRLGNDFLRDVLRHPEITEEIPTGATLAFHEIVLQSNSQPVRLTAFRLRRSKRWSVRVTGIGDLNSPEPTLPTSRWLQSISPIVEHATWASSTEAFAAVEGALRRANELHLLAS